MWGAPCQPLAHREGGAGSSEGAMRRAERQYGLSYWGQWNLRFKGRASLDFLNRLQAACLAAAEASVKRDLAYLRTEEAKGVDDASLESLVAEAEVLLAQIRKKKESMR